MCKPVLLSTAQTNLSSIVRILVPRYKSYSFCWRSDCIILGLLLNGRNKMTQRYIYILGEIALMLKHVVHTKVSFCLKSSLYCFSLFIPSGLVICCDAQILQTRLAIGMCFTSMNKLVTNSICTKSFSSKNT